MAVVVLLFAVLFVIAAYHVLTDPAGVTPIEAVGLVGGSLVCVGVLVLAVLPLVAKGNGGEWELIIAPGAGLALVDKGLAKATGQNRSVARTRNRFRRLLSRKSTISG